MSTCRFLLPRRCEARNFRRSKDEEAQVRRRDFLTILGGAAVLAPLNAGAQEARMRRLGVLFVYGEDHPEASSFVGALKEGLQSRGWIQGQTIHMEFRYCRSDPKL